MNIYIFLILVSGLVAHFGHLSLPKKSKFKTVLNYLGWIFFAIGNVALLSRDIFGGLISIAVLAFLMAAARGLDKDRRYLRNIYAEIRTIKKENVELTDSEILRKISDIYYPDLSEDVLQEIFDTAEDLDDMLYMIFEYDATGKIKSAKDYFGAEAELDE